MKDNFVEYLYKFCSSHLLLVEHPWLQNAKKASNVPLGDIVRARLRQFSVMNRFKKRALRVSSSSWYIYNFQLIFSNCLPAILTLLCSINGCR